MNTINTIIVGLIISGLFISSSFANIPEETIFNINKTIEYPEEWTCYDYAMNWSEQHPEYGILIVSHNPRFKLGYSENHFFNYIILPDKTLFTWDSETQKGFYWGGWNADTYTFEYLHFFVDGEVPTRHYSYLLPNAEVVYNNI